MRGEGSAREKVLETSIFLAEKGFGPEIGEMENDDGESGDPAASADVARQARVECFFIRRTVTCGRWLCAVL